MNWLTQLFIRHKAHEEQPPAAARARRFAAKYAPAGQRQIRTISGERPGRTME
jgi:hypothetical protein